MQIVIDKENIINMFSMALYTLSEPIKDYPGAKTCVNELLESIGYIELPKMKDELICKILMEVDGGTDDKYLNYLDVCERIEQSINEYFEGVKNNADSN